MMELVNIVKEVIFVVVCCYGGYLVKKSFQVIWIVVNDELGVLEDFLEQVLVFLKVGGWIFVIIFQFLEDCLVKIMFKEVISLLDLLLGLLVILVDVQFDFKLINKKLVFLIEDELKVNYWVYSVKFCVIERFK